HRDQRHGARALLHAGDPRRPDAARGPARQRQDLAAQALAVGELTGRASSSARWRVAGAGPAGGTRLFVAAEQALAARRVDHHGLVGRIGRHVVDRLAGRRARALDVARAHPVAGADRSTLARAPLPGRHEIALPQAEIRAARLLLGLRVIRIAVGQGHGVAVAHHGQADHLGPDPAHADQGVAAGLRRTLLAPGQALQRRALELHGHLQEPGGVDAAGPQIVAALAVLAEFRRIDAVQLNDLPVDLE